MSKDMKAIRMCNEIATVLEGSTLYLGLKSLFLSSAF